MTASNPWRKWRRRLLLGGAITLATGTVVVAVGNIWVVSAAGSHCFEHAHAVPARKVAIVPGARVWSDGTPSHALEDRLATALDLFRAGKVERVLVSGDHGAPEYDEPNAMRRWLVDRGVPSAAVFLDHAGFRTLDTMERARRVFGVDSAIVCTQGFHLARAVFLARNAGIDAVGLAADRRDYLNETYDGLRELLARPMALLDVAFGSEPRMLGPPRPVDGDARSTHDKWTTAGTP